MSDTTYSLRTKLLALCLAPVVFLLLVELAFRIVGYDPRPEAHFADIQDESVYIYHPRYFWTLRPDAVIHAVEQGFRDTRTNSLGLRGPEIPARKSGNEIRVLCLGDSITFGLGMLDDQTWPARAEQYLRAASNRPVVVVNAGVPGWASLQGMRLYRDLVAAGDYDYVVFWFGMNDAKEAVNGLPDDLYRSNAPAGFLGRSRLLDLVRFGYYTTLGKGARRVSTGEFGSFVRELKAAGRPRPVFIRCPERLDQTILEFETMVETAKESGADRVAGPPSLLSLYAPYRNRGRPNGRRVDTNLGPTILYGSAKAHPVNTTLDDVEKGLALLHGWKRALDRDLERLPEGALTARDLFGEPPSDTLIIDNCHLTAEGASRAGAAIGKAILATPEAR